jgi:hypothetical protein
MEDISRELEKEIARSKPKPYKQDRKTRLLIIDDFGQVKSREYLKTNFFYLKNCFKDSFNSPKLSCVLQIGNRSTG